MIILENITVSEDSLDKICQKIKEHFDNKEYKFDETVDTVNFWCDSDQDKTVYLQDGESYATIDLQSFNEGTMEEIVDIVKYQLENT